MRDPIPFLRLRRIGLASLAVAMVAGGLGGCKSVDFGDVTGSISTKAPPSDPAMLRSYTDELGKRYDAKPNDPNVAMAYARALRAQGQFAQAVAVLQTAAAKNAENRAVIGAFGKALADAGRFKEASEVLPRAHTPERPDWSVLSTQGSVADQLGDHAAAQGYYASALKIAPGEPSVLSNLGLSYALSKDLARAEDTLRQATEHPRADMRVRQNLALVLALRGKFDEAETVSRRDLSPTDASANVMTIRKMIVESNTWRQIQEGGKAKPAASRRG